MRLAPEHVAQPDTLLDFLSKNEVFGRKSTISNQKPFKSMKNPLLFQNNIWIRFAAPAATLECQADSSSPFFRSNLRFLMRK